MQASQVLGIDQFTPGHANGSSHGLSRIIRLAYFEAPQYVALLRRSYQLYDQLEQECGQRLLFKTGCLDIGGDCFSGALAAAQQHGLAHEVLTGSQVNQLYPGYHLPADMPVLYEPEGGILAPEDTIQAHLKVAQRHGAHVLACSKVVGWSAGAGGHSVTVHTSDKGSFHAASLVLAAGPWMAQLVPELKSACVPERQVVGWFASSQPSHFQLGSFPVFVMQDGAGYYYGFPEFGTPGFKIGVYHHLREVVSPDDISRELTAADVAALRAPVAKYFPSAGHALLRHSVCMFTNTQDGHFLIDHHPLHRQVLLCSACSGHGFKLGAVVGEQLALMALQQHSNSGLRGEMAMHRLSSDRPGQGLVLREFGV